MTLPQPGTPHQIVAFLRDEIAAAFDALEPWLSGDASLLAFRAVGEEWNIGRILEHVSLVNHYLLMLIGKGARKSVKRADPALIEKELENYTLAGELLEQIGINESFPWKCPDHMVPTGELSPAMVRGELARQRELLLENLVLVKNGEGVLFKTWMSVNGLGKLDVYQYIYFLLRHIRRHIQQMSKIESEYSAANS